MEKQSENLVLFKDISRLAFYTAIALGLFFFTAMAVFILRHRKSETVIMPDLVGKYYINVHNDLIQSRMMVQLEHRRYPDQPHGIVLYQSIPAGSVVGANDKVYVMVNEGEPVLNVPDLNGLSLQAARLTLERITRGDDVYSLESGAVTKIGLKNVPPGTVVGQFPPAGDGIMLHEKVYLLVATSPERIYISSIPGRIEGQQVDLAINWLQEMGYEYRIRKIERPGKGQVHGEIWNVETTDDGTVLLDVYYREPEFRSKTGYELLDVSLSGDPECTFVATPTAGNRLMAGEKVVYKYNQHDPDEKVKVLFYRRGEIDVAGKCGTKSVLERSFYFEKPDRV